MTPELQRLMHEYAAARRASTAAWGRKAPMRERIDTLERENDTAKTLLDLVFTLDAEIPVTEERPAT